MRCETWGARSLSFAGSRVTIEWSGPAAGALVDFLFRAVPEGAGGGAPVIFRVWQEGPDDELALAIDAVDGARPGAAMYRGSRAGLALPLLEQVTYHLADRSQGGLLFHAAAVSTGEGALLLPGASGAGKTSLAFWLAHRGFGLLTDELAYLLDGTATCQGLARPLHLKPPGDVLFPDVGQGDGLRLETGGWLAPVPAMGAAQPVVAVVCPRYCPGAALDCRRLSLAGAAIALTELLVNARNLPGHGFPALVQFARTVPAWSLTYGCFDGLEEQLNALFHSRSPDSAKKRE